MKVYTLDNLTLEDLKRVEREAVGRGDWTFARWVDRASIGDLMLDAKQRVVDRLNGRWEVVISGAQTGADRGGLEAATDLGLGKGGWVPKGWRAEDGTVPERYRAGLSESNSWMYPPRTRQNVMDSDATLIASLGELAAEGGSMLTAQLARRLDKPCRHVVVPASGDLTGVALGRVVEWLREVRPRVLNVAGPRESKEPGIQAATRRAVVQLFHACGT